MSWADQIAANDLALLTRLKTLTVSELEALVAQHNAAYWDKNTPEISDEAYDRLVEALRKAAPDSPLLVALGESRPQSNENRRFDTVSHEVPMLSLDKCYDDKTYLKWCQKIKGDFLAMPKIDGVACTLRYDQKGQLFLAATRGDGKQGDDITQNVLQIDDIPNQVSPELVAKNLEAGRTYMEVRGEVFMLLSRFHAHYAEDFANPRNLAAGSLKQKDPQKTNEAGLSFFPYGAMYLALDSEIEKVRLLAKMGFREIPTLLLSVDDDLTQGHLHFASQRDQLDYETDGVVIRADAVSEQARMGETAHHPKWAIAYKFQGESAQTKLEEVTWSLGRTGVITPVAVVAPVVVSGATVTRASLHNLAILNNLELTQNALVEVVRRGGVIPHVERVLSAGAGAVVAPTDCPSCGGQTLVQGDFLYCANPDQCEAVIKGRVAYFCSVIDLQGLGDKHLSGLIQKDLLRTPADLYALSVNQLEQLERMGPKLAAKIVTEVQNKKELPPAVFLAALGIPEIGPTVAETLCDAFGGFEPLFAVTEEDIQNVHGMGEAIAAALVTGLRGRRDEIDAMLRVVTLVQPQKPKAGELLFEGLSFVFTGKMAQLDRKSAQKAVQAQGGKTPSGVSKDLSYLVVGDDGSPLLGEGQMSTKQKKAEALVEKGASIRIISETDFLKIMAGETEASSEPSVPVDQLSLL